MPLVALAVEWCVLRLYWLRSPPAVGWIASGQALVVLILELSQLWTGPQEVESWLFVLTSASVGTLPLEWGTRPVLTGALATVTIGTYLAGQAVAVVSWG